MLAHSAPYVKAALKTRIEAALAAAGKSALVSRGLPYPKAWAGQTVIIGKAAGPGPTLVAARTQEQEEYDVQLLVNAAGSAQDAYSVFEDQAYGLAAVIKSDLNDWDPLPSGAWGRVTGFTPGGFSDEEGIEEDRSGAPKSRDCTVTLEVHVSARLVSSG